VLLTLDKADILTLNVTIGGAQASSSKLTVNPAALNRFVVSAPSQATAGTAVPVSVKALDVFGNTVTTYTGPAYLYSSDGQAVTPTYVTLTNGVGTAQVTLSKPGTVTLTALYSSVKGVSSTIVVNA
jgi:hypothetical protein